MENIESVEKEKPQGPLLHACIVYLTLRKEKNISSIEQENEDFLREFITRLSKKIAWEGVRSLTNSPQKSNLQNWANKTGYFERPADLGRAKELLEKVRKYEINVPQFNIDETCEVAPEETITAPSLETSNNVTPISDYNEEREEGEILEDTTDKELQQISSQEKSLLPSDESVDELIHLLNAFKVSHNEDVFSLAMTRIESWKK